MCNKGRQYNISVEIVTEAKEVTRVRNCNGIMFTNVGDTIAFVNGMVIFPSATPTTDLGDSRSIGGNEGELYTGNITLVFAQPLGVTPRVEIVQKFYIKDVEPT